MQLETMILLSLQINPLFKALKDEITSQRMYKLLKFHPIDFVKASPRLDTIRAAKEMGIEDEDEVADLDSLVTSFK